jgi:hypothetical protein
MYINQSEVWEMRPNRSQSKPEIHCQVSQWNSDNCLLGGLNNHWEQSKWHLDWALRRAGCMSSEHKGGKVERGQAGFLHSLFFDPEDGVCFPKTSAFFFFE